MRLIVIGAVVTALVGWLPSGASAQEGRRTADEILAEIDAVTRAAREEPRPGDDPATRAEFLRRQTERRDRRDALVWELYKTHPGHKRVPNLLAQRWISRYADPQSASADEAMREIEQVLAECRDPKLVTAVAFLRADAVIRMNMKKPAEEWVKVSLPAIEDGIRRAPKDESGATNLFKLLWWRQDLPATIRDELEERILRDYPDSLAAGMVKKARHRRDSVGKPFALTFTDAIRGTEVSTEGLRGKVVVIDFWSTTCGPCVAEMPELKELYARYHDQGVEFIGVSLDRPKEEGGLDRLKTFVEKNQIPWPQYHTEGWGFAESWGVFSIPAVFVVDAQGNLASVDARGKLDQLIPMLLKPRITERPTEANPRQR